MYYRKALTTGIRFWTFLIAGWLATGTAQAGPIVIEVMGASGPEALAGADPYALTMALRKARDIRRLAEQPFEEEIRIVLKDGYYPLVESLQLHPEDSGSSASPTVIMAVEGAQPVLTGGMALTDWQRVKGVPEGAPAEAKDQLWMVQVPTVGGRSREFRQLWINGVRAHRARDRFENEMHRLLEWDKELQEGWIPSAGLEGIVDPGRLEMVVHQMWAISILRVASIDIEGERARIRFHTPERRIQFEHPWPPVVISESGNSAYYLVNHLRLLDQPGEYYQDMEQGILYYWPRSGETIAEAVGVVPVLETLVEIEGTPDQPVRHIEFRGIQFSHTAWQRPGEAGHVPLQAGMALLDAYKLKEPGTPDKAGLENQAWVQRPVAAVTVSGADAIQFTGCHFRHLGASGLDFIESVTGAGVNGNLFRDIGGNGLVMGSFAEVGPETHVPYDPSDERRLCQDSVIADNLFTDVANEDWGCVGILVGYARGIGILHNEVCDVSYSGISLGWGWTKSVNCMRDNRIEGNRIHHFGKRMYDTGGIYTLSPQPGSVITRNVVHSIYRPDFVHDPNHWSYIYLDEGSSYFTVQDNWTEGLKYSTNANGPGNTWENNGPSVSAKILQRAGIREPYKALLDMATVAPDGPVIP